MGRAWLPPGQRHGHVVRLTARPGTGAPFPRARANSHTRRRRADATCAGDYPRFAQDIDRAFARVRKQGVTVAVSDVTGTSEVTFGPSDLAYATRGVLYGDVALSLPLWFREASGGS